MKDGVSEGTGIDDNKRKDVKKSGIGIRIIGIVHFLFIVGKKVLSYLLLKIVQSAMAIMELIILQEGFNLVIKVCSLMSRSEGKRQYMIGWGAGSVCTKGLVNALHIFQGTKKNSKRWQMQESLMKKYFTGIPIYVVWRQLGLISQFGKLSFLSGVQKV
jgi:hypothetical protein